ncbi:mitochondrial 54S ribosomal protein bL31m [Phyllosticta citriasiana]|uniref:mitochondrial 54S ribosomal protein bL31m n=1 Tax=Phyllosticta citriasiana TaxID=595635 RepID=UPI0030FD2612
MSTLFTAARAPRPVAQPFKISQTQTRNATLIRRPKRPYQFTQVVTLSDGSTFMHRTTSPEPLYKSTKDVKNSLLWNPSSQKLANAEDDLAGRLRSFRNRFGRGWDSAAGKKASEAHDGNDAKPEDEYESMIDLISRFNASTQKEGQSNSGKKGKGST